MTGSRDRDLKPHRFFHAMVLMGGSLALGCGGTTSADSDQHGSGEGGAGPKAGTTGGNGSTGGTTVGTGGGRAGDGGAGGAPALPSGGTGATEPPPPECPTSQWDCLGEGAYCDGYGFSLPNDCTCSSLRPKSPADCEADEDFVCLDARRDSNGNEFTTPVPFSCRCMPAQDRCELHCDEVTSPGASCGDLADDAGDTVLCGCALIVLR